MIRVCSIKGVLTIYVTKIRRMRNSATSGYQIITFRAYQEMYDIPITELKVPKLKWPRT